jgi:hypothetical protein
MLHNAHVLKYMRWQHFLAVANRRHFAQIVWATWYQMELANADTFAVLH